jgi:hypothetical protein
MADCDSPTLSVPTLACVDDLPAWATALVASLQAAIDHVVGCVVDFAYPQCDICVLKDDLVSCPLIVSMIDFTDITYDDEGGVGVLPYPDRAGLDFRYGTGTTAEHFFNTWRSAVVTFDTPFETECVWVGVTAVSEDPCYHSDEAENCEASGVHVEEVQGIIVQEDTISTTGFTVWFRRGSEDLSCSCYVNFRYLAAGT